MHMHMHTSWVLLLNRLLWPVGSHVSIFLTVCFAGVPAWPCRQARGRLGVGHFRSQRHLHLSRRGTSSFALTASGKLAQRGGTAAFCAKKSICPVCAMRAYFHGPSFFKIALTCVNTIPPLDSTEWRPGFAYFSRQVDNRIKHSKAGTVETVPERKKKIVKELT